MTGVVGWDIGAVNVKAAWCGSGANGAVQGRVLEHPFEIWREKEGLQAVLRSVFDSITAGALPRAMAVTMTAELSDAFDTKREGVLFILEKLRAGFPDLPAYVFSLSGEFVTVSEAQVRPLDFAASNWVATATWIAGQVPNCLIIDVGSTTTDILPVVTGQLRALGYTDPERLASGELIYTGALRTNLAAVVSSVPLRGQSCRVASEYFAVSGDVHLILGHLTPGDYSCPTPDGRPPSVDSARKRVARLVCADTEILSAAEILDMARFIHNRQVRQIRGGIEQVISRLPALRTGPAIILGSGAFLGEAAAREMELEIIQLPVEIGREQMEVAPCVAVAQLLSDHLEGRRQ